MVEITVIFHHIPIRMAIDICRACDKVTGDNRHLHAKGMEIVLHVLIKFPVHQYTKFHKVRISCRAFLRIPLTVRIIDRLVKASRNASHGS